jgi:hypothetical protein
MLKRFIACLAVLALSGCATVFTGSTNNVQMRVVDAESNELIQNVKCSVTDSDGIVYLLSSNPGQIIATKGKGTLRVDCKKPGYTQQNMGIAQTINGVTFVNVLFWPGFIVDAVTGNMHKYPANVTIQMKKQ